MKNRKRKSVQMVKIPIVNFSSIILKKIKQRLCLRICCKEFGTIQ